jgi:hypothetical protein
MSKRRAEEPEVEDVEMASHEEEDDESGDDSDDGVRVLLPFPNFLLC